MAIDPRGQQGPPRESRTRSLAGAVLSTVPLVLLPFAVNVASDSLPGGAQRWAWLSWPAIIILTAVSWRLATPPAEPRQPRPRQPPPQQAPPNQAPPNQPPPYQAPPQQSPPYQAPPRQAPPHEARRSPPPPPWAQPPRPWTPSVPRSATNPWRGLAIPLAGLLTGLLLSQFHLVGVHAPFAAGALIVLIALALCLAESLMPARVPRGIAAGLTYTVLAGAAVLKWDSSRADLLYVAESAVILGLGVFLATRIRDPRTVRRVLPGVVLTLLGWGAMGVLFAIYQGDDETNSTLANAGFFACLSTVIAGTLATSLQAFHRR